jgi:hypothetical protein
MAQCVGKLSQVNDAALNSPAAAFFFPRAARASGSFSYANLLDIKPPLAKSCKQFARRKDSAGRAKQAVIDSTTNATVSR